MITDVRTLANNSTLTLPNGVTVLSDGQFVVADGGNDRVCLFNPKGELIKKVGAKGYGKYKFREPVGIFSSDEDKIFVADWHNHRVVIYSSDLVYQDEIGHYDPGASLKIENPFLNIIERLLRFTRKLTRTGTYDRYYFTDEKVSSNNNPDHMGIISRTQMSVNNIRYWTTYRNKTVYHSLRTVLKTGMNKPNGVATIGNKIYISQKNFQCIYVYVEGQFSHPKYIIKKPKKGESFGRLGNITYHDGRRALLVCDEHNHTIWMLNPHGDYIDKITGQKLSDTEFYPFSCCVISDNLLGVAGSEYLYIIKLDEYKAIEKIKLGEPHGIDYDCDRKYIYVPNRSDDKLHRIKIDI